MLNVGNHRLLSQVSKGTCIEAMTGAIGLDAEGKAPSEFRIFSAGVNTSDKGDILFDDAAAKSVMSAWAKKAAPLTMDYEHQAAADPPVKALAAAYSWTPEVRNGELWATNVGWTDEARQEIESRKYNYFSPLFLSDPKTKRVLKVINLALTNTPALDGLQPLIAASAARGEDPMKCKACKSTIKDDDDAFCEDCFGKGAKAMTAATAAAIGLRADVADTVVIDEIKGVTELKTQLLALTGAKTASEVIGTVNAWKANGEQVVKLTAQIEKAAEDKLRSDFNAVVEKAVTDGKLPPAEKDKFVAMTLALTGGKVTKEAIAGVEAYVSTRAAMVRTEDTRHTVDPNATGDVIALSAADREMAERLHHDPAEVAKWNAEVRQAQAARQ